MHSIWFFPTCACPTTTDWYCSSISESINMERDSISRIEIGTRFVSDFELKIFAEVLGVSVQWLLGIDE